jgi:hypothetical protein
MNNTKQQNNKGNSGSNGNTFKTNTALINNQGNGNNNKGNNNKGNNNIKVNNNMGNNNIKVNNNMGNNNIKVNNNNNVKPMNTNINNKKQSPIIDFFTPGNTSNTSKSKGFFSFKNILFILFILFGVVVIAGLSLGIYYIVKYFKNNKDVESDNEQIPELGASASQSDEVEPVEEVFHVRANKYTYDDAEAVCKALDAKLATHEQLIEAQAKGANWCSYGWVKSSDGKSRAFYPIQPEFWYNIQNNNSCGLKDKCGKPGINGGSFDKDVLLGVNCYGVKRAPTDEEKELTNTLCSGDLETDEKVAQYRNELANAMFSPFSQGRWSGL